jgi:sugar phosphate isomerase/epimerase
MTEPLSLAVQLYSFRDPSKFGGAGMGLDVETLTAISEMGYLGVETVDVPGGDPVAARRVIDELGLQIASSHAWASLDDRPALVRSAEAIAELGSPRMIVSASGLASMAALQATVDALGAAAEIASTHGLRFGIHNHSEEMAVLDGLPVIDRLAAALPEIDLQVDIFWAAVGGADPAEVIDRLGHRVVSLHLKDGIDLPTAADAEPFVNVAVGDGVVDPAPAIAAATASRSVEWLIVEFDHVVGSSLEAARRSLDHLVARGLGRSRAS